MSVRFVAATCPQCSGSLQLPENLESAKCSYCGATVTVEQSGKTDQDVKRNLIELARVEHKSGNYEAAYSLFSDVLRIDPGCSEAWQGKGNCAGWLSNLSRDRFDEMFGSHEKALELKVTEVEKELLSMEMGLEQFKIAKAFFDLSHEHTIEFISVRSAQFEHADRICRIIEVCENAKKLNPELSIGSFVYDIASRAGGILLLDQTTKDYLLGKKSQYAVKPSGDTYRSLSGSSVAEPQSSSSGSPILGFLFLLGVGALLVKCIA